MSPPPPQVQYVKGGLADAHGQCRSQSRSVRNYGGGGHRSDVITGGRQSGRTGRGQSGHNHSETLLGPASLCVRPLLPENEHVCLCLSSHVCGLYAQPRTRPRPQVTAPPCTGCFCPSKTQLCPESPGEPNHRFQTAPPKAPGPCIISLSGKSTSPPLHPSPMGPSPLF